MTLHLYHAESYNYTTNYLISKINIWNYCYASSLVTSRSLLVVAKPREAGLLVIRFSPFASRLWPLTTRQ